MRGAARRDAGQGFALVEMLASLVIVAMISLMLVEGVGTGHQVWRRIETRKSAGEAIDGAQTRLRGLLEQTYPATLFDKNPPYVDFEGNPSRLVFLANPPVSRRPAPLRRYTLGLTTAGDLVLWSVSDVNPAATDTATREVLLRGVRSLDVAYFGVVGTEPAHLWSARWSAQPAPPLAVRIRLAFDPGDRRVWPDLIVQPRATIDTACMLNTMTARCKGRA